MPSARKGDNFDTTYLDPAKSAERQVIHRDMIAHAARWSFVVKFLSTKSRYKTWHVLDAGCGRLTNLAKTLYHNMKTHTTGSYTGVDYGKIPWPESIPEDTKKFKMRLHEKMDFAEFDPEDQPKGGWDLVTSFECLEHMQPYSSYAVLKNMRRLVTDQSTTMKNRTDRGYAIISTPKYDPVVGAAANHINEMSYDALQALIYATGWEVEQVFGTFASQRDYKKTLKPHQLEVFQQLSEFYDSTMVSNIMAPIVDAKLARNCMWVLRPSLVDTGFLKDKTLANAEHSNSPKWKAHRTKILKELK